MTLLEKAKATSQTLQGRKLPVINEEEVELLMAILNGELSLKQIGAALNTHPWANVIAAWCWPRVKQLYRAGRLNIDERIDHK